MKNKIPKQLEGFQGEIRISVETFYIYEYKVKYFVLYCMIQCQSYDFSTVTAFF